ncbi:MAG: sigma-54-dependent Fis family transcriptional regulator [Candidatus Rokuibacteriota bacterium]|nr:MAG: sigma-54-dependent Fis family transcriptional regulator [Candidatus Rokubacteria bacterium]
MTKILIVDDEPLYRHGLFELLRRPNLKVDAAADGDEALRLFRRGGYQMVISDLSMPGLDGLGLMRAVKRESPSTRFVILSGVGTIQAALTAVRQGADDFLEKPVSREQINEVLARVATPVMETGIVTANPTMLDRLERARRIAPTDATVLVQGESGTGKEMVAQAIHGWSARAAAPFVALNCAAMPDTLVEAELFGHERGAFTDARAARPGVIEQADGGTLFLDEIAEMPAVAQAKLLRVLQDKCVRRLGATTTQAINVRFIAATNRPLRAMVAERRFREDLYYRLDVMALELPPLRERPEDIPRLAEHFVRRFNADYGWSATTLTAAACDRLRTHSWPGNVRELENTLHRAVIEARGSDIEVAHLALDAAILAPVASGNLAGRSWDQVERELIMSTLARVNGNRKRAARLMGMGERTLRNRLREYQRDGVAV